MKTGLKVWLSAAGAVLALVACGGGGDAGTPLLGGGSSSGGTSSSGGSSGVSENYEISISLSSSTVTAAAPATVSAQVLSASGVPQPNVVVKFAATDGRGMFSPDAALTDASGVANTVVTPADGVLSGADTITATATIGTETLSASAGFQLTATNVGIASFSPDAQTLAAYGQTGLTVTLSGSTTGTPVSVALSSACVTKGLATLTPQTVTTTTGVASFTYRDQGCGAFDTADGLQASVTGTAATASLSLGLTAPTVSSISFVSAVPQEIYLKGSGLTENANITFQLRDANGAGVPNQTVVLEPTTLAGGVLIDGGSVAVTKQTDSEGKVLVRINAGTVPTPVRVKATLAGSQISTVSSSLAIAVGLPSQSNFSLSQKTHNIEGYNIDGIANTYTIIASDRLGNPVPAATAINFVTEGGQIEAIRQTALSNGLSSATANFQSASPRPADGRVTVLAYALGEESFLDTNGNNVYDTGEDHQDLGDVFLDRLYNVSYNAAEDQFIALGVSGTDACNLAASTLLRLDASMPSRTATQAGAAQPTCTSGWGRAYVRRAAQTVLSTSAARPLLGTTLPAGAKAASGQCPSPVSLIKPISVAEPPYNASDAANSQAYFRVGTVVLTGLPQVGQFSFLVADANPLALNPVAAGSTVSVTASTGLTASVTGGSPVPSTLSPTGAIVDYAFDDETDSGVLTISIKSPSGLTTTVTQAITQSERTDLASCP
jgi:hypothetical protein